jgi:archaellum component FlaC
VEDAKIRVLGLVDDVFNDIAHQLKVKISKQYNLLGEFQQVRDHLQMEIQKVSRVLQDFDSPIDYVKATIYSVEKQLGTTKNTVLEDLKREIEHYEAQLPEVSVDVRTLDEIYELL